MWGGGGLSPTSALGSKEPAPHEGREWGTLLPSVSGTRAGSRSSLRSGAALRPCRRLPFTASPVLPRPCPWARWFGADPILLAGMSLGLSPDGKQTSPWVPPTHAPGRQEVPCLEKTGWLEEVKYFEAVGELSESWAWESPAHCPAHCLLESSARHQTGGRAGRSDSALGLLSLKPRPQPQQLEHQTLLYMICLERTRGQMCGAWHNGSWETPGEGVRGRCRGAEGRMWWLGQPMRRGQSSVLEFRLLL